MYMHVAPFLAEFTLSYFKLFFYFFFLLYKVAYFLLLYSLPSRSITTYAALCSSHYAAVQPLGKSEEPPLAKSEEHEMN